jgi:hypothetical protein
MRRPGFRKVRRQAGKRVASRPASLRLFGVSAYRGYLETDLEEWRHLSELCWIAIPRSYWNTAVFDHLGKNALPTTRPNRGHSGGLPLGLCNRGDCQRVRMVGPNGFEPLTSTVSRRIEGYHPFARLRKSLYLPNLAPLDKEPCNQINAGTYYVFYYNRCPWSVVDNVFLRYHLPSTRVIVYT